MRPSSHDPPLRHIYEGEAPDVARGVGSADHRLSGDSRKNVRVFSNLLGKRTISSDAHQAIPSIFQSYHDFAVAEYGTALLTPKQAKALNRKVQRIHALSSLPARARARGLR